MRLGLAAIGTIIFFSASSANGSEFCGSRAKPPAETNPVPETTNDPVPVSVEYGARIYLDQCSLCHGPKGMGEGAVPVRVDDYPSTSLLEPKHGQSRADIRKVVYLGGGVSGVDPRMPPWSDELTCIGLESVVDFVELLRTDTARALELVRQASHSYKPTYKKGREIFLTRCVLCHGYSGQGDGKLSNFIKDPPPFNLTKSQIDDAYLRRIIAEGGAAVGRSPRMPAWGDEVVGGELESLILYVKSLRD